MLSGGQVALEDGAHHADEHGHPGGDGNGAQHPQAAAAMAATIRVAYVSDWKAP
jgi:hypothetical protein